MPVDYVNVCRALFDYDAQNDDELSFKEDDVLFILEHDDDKWWKAKLKPESGEALEDAQIGLIPNTYVAEAECKAVVKAMYDYDAQNDEELSFTEDSVFYVYDNDDSDWYLVKSGDLFGFVPANYVEEATAEELAEADECQEDGDTSTGQATSVSLFQALSSAMHKNENNEKYKDPLQSYAARQKLRPTNDVRTWIVSEIDKKKKKRKGKLVIGAGKVFYACESDKAAPVQQWDIQDVLEIKNEKKHVLVSFGGSKPATFDFQAKSRSEAEAIVTKAKDCRAEQEIPTVHLETPPSRASVASPSAASSSSRASQSEPEQETQEAQLDDRYDDGYDDDQRYDRQQDEYEQYEQYGQEDQPEEQGLPSPKLGVALYDFDAQNEDELTVREGDEVLIIDDVTSEEWWKCRIGDEEGVVPASYINIKAEGEAERAAEAQTERSQRDRRERARQEAERKRKDAERRQKKQKEEAERQRKRLEEAALAAATPPAPPALPRRPPTRAKPTNQDAVAKKIQTPTNRALPDRPAQAQSKSKPMPSKTRTWTDRTGSFKVEAEFLQFIDGKVHLHKLNGVKIAVAIDKMSNEDIAYLQNELGVNIDEKTDASDSEPLAKIAAAQHKRNKPDYDWFDFFLQAHVAYEDAYKYATAFLEEKMDESSIPELERGVMKGLGVKEGDIIRVKKYIEQKYTNKTRKAVSFGGADVIPDDRSTKSSHEKRKSAEELDQEMAVRIQAEEIQRVQKDKDFNKVMQLKRDEQLARELQEEENRLARSQGRTIPKAADIYGSSLGGIIQKEDKKSAPPPMLFSGTDGSLKNNTKKVRPQATKSAAIQIDSNSFVSAKDKLDEVFKPSQSSMQKDSSGFDDDAWSSVSKDSTPTLMPTAAKPAEAKPIESKPAATAPPPPPPPPPPSAPPPAQPPPRLAQPVSYSQNLSSSQVPPQIQQQLNALAQQAQATPPATRSIAVPVNATLPPAMIPQTTGIGFIPTRISANPTGSSISSVGSGVGPNLNAPNSVPLQASVPQFQQPAVTGGFGSMTPAWPNSGVAVHPTGQFTPSPGLISQPNQFTNSAFTPGNSLRPTNSISPTLSPSMLPQQSPQPSSKFDPQNVFASMKAGQLGSLGGANANKYDALKSVNPQGPGVFSSQSAPPSQQGFGMNQAGPQQSLMPNLTGYNTAPGMGGLSAPGQGGYGVQPNLTGFSNTQQQPQQFQQPNQFSGTGYQNTGFRGNTGWNRQF